MSSPRRSSRHTLKGGVKALLVRCQCWRLLCEFTYKARCWGISGITPSFQAQIPSTDSDMNTSAKVTLCILAWLVLHGADAVMIYFFVQASVDPNPRTPVNRTHTIYIVYQAFMYILGGVLTLFNFAAVLVYLDGEFGGTFGYRYEPVGRHHYRSTLFYVILLLTLIPATFFCIMPVFGPLIILPVAQKWAWNHRCDSYPMYAILDARGVKDASFTPNIAHFYSKGDVKPLFSYSVNDDSSSDLWTFQLREFDSPQGSIPLQQYPTLQQVRYDFINHTVMGNCTTLISPGSSATNSTSCTSGTFNPYDWLSFNLTSSVPLNNSISRLPPTTAHLGIIDKEWAFSNDAPSLILQTTPDPQQLPVLRTAVTKRSDCTQLKVCLAGVDGREGGVVGAEVLVPLGLILIRQSDYATFCTTPKRRSTTTTWGHQY
ncbi:hypothetical protein BXZ70DRAFT_926691 [Cristinia sonorae]|uniref:Uncharacterized protein n=1 Tax=Cristinia sonorae TaxID=1940300 RepID=A0A8K0UTD2_9AGAR|nr:hypothetical protein BXZ70DRAFT_926691 [Cristinia sonorae]